MIKTCPSCGRQFECRADDVTHCQCAKVVLSAEQRKRIAALFGECLCAECLNLQKHVS